MSSTKANEKSRSSKSTGITSRESPSAHSVDARRRKRQKVAERSSKEQEFHAPPHSHPADDEGEGEDEDDADGSLEEHDASALDLLNALGAAFWGTRDAQPIVSSTQPIEVADLSSMQAARTPPSLKQQEKHQQQQQQHPSSSSSSDISPTSATSERNSSKSKGKLEPMGKKAREVQNVVFDPSARKTQLPGAVATGGLGRFMSSKVRRPTQDDEAAASLRDERSRFKGEDGEAESNEEKSQKKNDVLLSQLLSSTLFAPGGERSISSTSASTGKRSLNHKDTAARLMELSSSSSSSSSKSSASGAAGRSNRVTGRGLGEKLLRANKLSEVPASIRTGIRSAERQKLKDRVEREKEMGNWHASIKHRIGREEGDGLILDARRNRAKGGDGDRDAKARRKGLGLGMGSFKGGTLRLTREEVGRIRGEEESFGGRRGAKAGQKRKK
ncbi:hypothetical protein IE81DRAFT_348972 [Ceraceosorus guamensis]|uniref:Uncharacterized protein n=1 Tax=Ceraceosorus guamensis TaxID=1522189 RepID=A0A316VWU7_9BASI|nr:hypothetical protein IE81DRAFT_348972 [Ceraceosorus guamensis]PWN40751.1 hypothetical protein IE81DRAFT_348972 [Ceraceosorus guamensis]